MEKRPNPARRHFLGILPRVGLCVIGLALGHTQLPGQEPQSMIAPVDAPSAAKPLVTVHGLVINAATGQPLPRALVTVNSGESIGALSDGEGRFEIPGVPRGEQSFEVFKPGFEPQAEAGEGFGAASHVVVVSGDMPELSFSLTPKNAIYGHVTLSSGAPAEGIGLVLMKQTILDGRASWTEEGRHQTTPNGEFRYSGLSDGTYLLMTDPEFDNDHAAEATCSADAPTEMPGYAPMFYGDAREIAEAARISLAAGQSAVVNLALNLTNFHLVELSVSRAPTAGEWSFQHTLATRSGLVLNFPVHEEKNHALCAYLPDGSYMIAVQGFPDEAGQLRESSSRQGGKSKDLAGVLEFSVDGEAARHLHIPLAPAVSTPVRLRYVPGPPPPIASTEDNREEGRDSGEPLELSAARLNSTARQFQMQLAPAVGGNESYELESALPGSYWVHATANRAGTCMGPVTAGGQNLARVPWVAGPSGAGAPIDVVLRTDCAKLTFQLPLAMATGNSGEQPRLYVYAIPEFDSIEGANEVPIEPFGDHTATIEVTPGPYRIFVFPYPRSIEIHNTAAVDRLGAGQEVVLTPGGTTHLVLKISPDGTAGGTD